MSHGGKVGQHYLTASQKTIPGSKFPTGFHRHFPEKRETQAGKSRGVAGSREQEGEGAGTIALIYETEGRGRSGQKGRKGQSRQ